MIGVVMGDIAEVAATAIMHPVSAEWDPVTPAMRRLELAAGDVMTQQCAKIGELPVGSAVITSAGAVKAEFMVHVIVRSAVEAVTESGVQRGLQNGLRRCLEWGIESIAVPPIGTGAGNLDPEEVAQLMVPILLEHMRAAPYPAQVYLVAETEYERDAFQQQMRHYDLPLLSDGRQ